ncbi:FAD-dependent oxidoreductase [Jiangella rhizosphaerae]|uniref:FAD-dependent oxidoreductase n=1 Tax=Jiangella rhizosphaerae TaxID=2293569 RepID=A0A418KH23_9ACTN|nr:FAD-dependent oxidoreductase [Jiangella rhizosphaerae]RIQ11350.1 FAD-dependent oxidoreductase [Jiangella rhizosphaerae]
MTHADVAVYGGVPGGITAAVAAAREGAAVLDEAGVWVHDVQHDRRKPDAIAISSHFIDSHHVQRLAVSPTEFVNEGRIWRIGRAYQIPYRSLIPKRGQCTNLIVPVAASFTHVAFCTYRLESTWMTAGQAAGVAAVQVARDGTAVQDLDVAELQARLSDQGQIIDFVPGQPERFPGGPGWREF